MLPTTLMTDSLHALENNKLHKWMRYTISETLKMQGVSIAEPNIGELFANFISTEETPCIMVRMPMTRLCFVTYHDDVNRILFEAFLRSLPDYDCTYMRCNGGEVEDLAYLAQTMPRRCAELCEEGNFYEASHLLAKGSKGNPYLITNLNTSVFSAISLRDRTEEDLEELSSVAIDGVFSIGRRSPNMMEKSQNTTWARHPLTSHHYTIL